MELNGFEIDKFNQYNIPINAKVSTCPECSSTRKKKTEKCMKVFWDTGLGQCCHCGAKIQLHTYKKKTERPIMKKPTVKCYAKPASPATGGISEKLEQYWKGRGISKETLKALNVHVSTEWMPQTKKEIPVMCFPYTRNGEHINTKYRGSYKNDKGESCRAFKMVTNAQKIAYNWDNVQDASTCIIVEGEPDVLTFHESGFKYCTSSPNGSTLHTVNTEWLDDSFEIFDNKEIIYLGMDNDSAGQNVQAELIRRLGASRIRIINYPEGCKDANEVLMKHGIEAVRNLIETAKEIPIENVLDFGHIEDDLLKFYSEGHQSGYKTGVMPELDEVFSVYTKQIIIWTGIPTHGKSEQVDQYVLGLCITNGFSAAYCSVENEPHYIHCDKILRKLAGKKTTYNNYGERDVLECGAWMYKRLSFIHKTPSTVIHDKGKVKPFVISETLQSSSYSLEFVLESAAELVRRKGIKILVLDPYNKIPLKSAKGKVGTPEYTGEYMNVLDSFCKTFDVLIILVAHPVKMPETNGVFDIPNLYNVKGGGEFYDMTYHGLVTYRDITNQTVLTKVLKCKFNHLGQNGAAVRFRWDYETGRYHGLSGTESDPMGDRIINKCSKNWVTGASIFKQQKTEEFIETLPF